MGRMRRMLTPLLALATTHGLFMFSLAFCGTKHQFRMTPLFLSTETHRTLAQGSHKAEMEVKKSRFIACASHVQSWDQAQAYIEFIRKEHPKARHWCFGFRSGTVVMNERCSDDGEPTGTAGLPILGAIKGEGLSDTVCVVVRYFGGIKLGSGGLIRAYGAAARQVLREAPVEVLIATSTSRVTVDASHIGALYDIALRHNVVILGEEYGGDGSLTVNLTCKTVDLEQLIGALNDATRGQSLIQDDSLR